MMRQTAAVSLPLLLLTACNDAPKNTGSNKAEGEVLAGSVSDAMLPLDTVRSQAPLAPRSEGKEGEKDKDRAKDGESKSDEAEPSPAPEAPDEAAEAEE